MWGREVKAGVAHFMCVEGRDSITAQDAEERKPANQPSNQIKKKNHDARYFQRQWNV